MRMNRLWKATYLVLVKTNNMSSNTMKAMVLEQHGAAYKAETIARPVADPGQVLVKIMASGINPLDLKIKSGNGGHAKQPLPAILGLDLAGVVEAVGEGITAFTSGDEVFGMAGGVGGLQGTLAQYAAVDADLIAHKPHNLSMKEAAAVPLVFITAWEGLVDRAQVKAGQKVLVHGGPVGLVTWWYSWRWLMVHRYMLQPPLPNWATCNS
jgi:NADPH2:quinone reductase